MERVSKLEGAYEHMASKAELAELNGEFKEEYVRTRMLLDSIQATQQAIIAQMNEMQQILERIDRSNSRNLGFQTSREDD